MDAIPSDHIEHVVVLMLENHSFDQMLGALKEVHPDLNGVNPEKLVSNADDTGYPYEQWPTKTCCIKRDPKHELRNVLRQIDKLSELSQSPKQIGEFQRCIEWLLAGLQVVLSYCDRAKPVLRKMSLAAPYTGKFVLDYAKEYQDSTREERKEIMGYYPLGFLHALHSLAREYTVCDKWFSSLPGPTWANRFFVNSGTALGRVWMPETKSDIPKMRPYDQPTLYDRLNEKPITWRIYFGDIPQSLVLTHQLDKENIVNYRPMARFYEDAAGPESDFPKYCFIEPSYFLSNANDDHPPHNTMHAQCLIADVYNALRKNEELWKTTLLVILYDEHGGFFDHVEPELAKPPDTFADEYTFDRFGVRVPVVLVSPWTKKGVLSDKLDHTSLLKYLTDKWELGPLGSRVKASNSISEAFVTEPRQHVLPRIEDSEEMKAARIEAASPDVQMNGNQQALIVFSKFLSALLDTSGLPAILRTQAMKLASRNAETDHAQEIEDAKQIVNMLIEQEQRTAALQN